MFPDKMESRIIKIKGKSEDFYIKYSVQVKNSTKEITFEDYFNEEKV